MILSCLMLAATAQAEVVPAHNNYKPTIVLDNPGPNVLTGCGEQGRVATLRQRIPPAQTDGNAWDRRHAVRIRATGQLQYFEVKPDSSEPWVAWPSSGLLNLQADRPSGQHTLKVRARAGQNIVRGSAHAIFLTLEKIPGTANLDKYNVLSPAIRLTAFGGKGCQTRAQNPTCRGHWQWAGFDPVVRQLIGPPTCPLE